ncbi:MAG: hypothetical protein AB1640_13215, partial [bacterium]
EDHDSPATLDHPLSPAHGGEGIHFSTPSRIHGSGRIVKAPCCPLSVFFAFLLLPDGFFHVAAQRLQESVVAALAVDYFILLPSPRGEGQDEGCNWLPDSPSP